VTLPLLVSLPDPVPWLRAALLSGLSGLSPAPAAAACLQRAGCRQHRWLGLGLAPAQLCCVRPQASAALNYKGIHINAFDLKFKLMCDGMMCGTQHPEQHSAG
jgi:hypothetical protein